MQYLHLYKCICRMLYDSRSDGNCGEEREVLSWPEKLMEKC
jgi:hypothetical protein